VTSSVEQLYYTWAPRGVEGINQFQVAAISPGLKAGPAMAAMPMVRRLCRYDRPRGQGADTPVSFGWLEHEGYRIAFRRVGLPAEMGKRGNFAAHCLVALTSDLSEAAIAASFGAPFWWDGIKVGQEEEPSLDLPAIGFAEITVEGHEPRAEETQAGIALAYHVFTKPPEARLSIAASAEDLGRALRVVAWLAPEALAGLSFSTYEGHPVFPFDLIGSEAPQPGLLSCSLVLPDDLDEGGLLTLDQLAKGDCLGRAAARTARAEGTSTAGAIWDAAKRIVGLGRGEADTDVEDLLADAGAIGIICETEQGRAAVAAAAQRGRPGVLAAIGAAAAAMKGGNADALTAAIADRYRSSSQAFGCAAIADALGGSRGEVVLEAALTLALVEEKAAATLSAEDAARLLARASRRGASVAEAELLLRGARVQIAACAAEPEVPTPYLARMFVLGLDDPFAPVGLVAAVRARPGLLAEVRLDETGKDRCFNLLRRLDPQGRQDLIPSFLYELADDPWGRGLWPLLSSLPPAVAARCVLDAPRRDFAAAPPDSISQICDDLATGLLSTDATRLALQILGRSGSKESDLAVRLVEGIGQRADANAAIAIEAVERLGRWGLGGAVAELAAERAVASVRAPTDVAAAWRALEALLPEAGEEEVLHRLLAAAVRDSQAAGAAEILAWIAAREAPSGSKLFTMRGSLRDAESDAMALELVARTPAFMLEQIDESLEPSSRYARKWWKHLVKAREGRART
jgi:hypothetical protein